MELQFQGGKAIYNIGLYQWLSLNKELWVLFLFLLRKGRKSTWFFFKVVCCSNIADSFRGRYKIRMESCEPWFAHPDLACFISHVDCVRTGFLSQHAIFSLPSSQTNKKEVNALNECWAESLICAFFPPASLIQFSRIKTGFWSKRRRKLQWHSHKMGGEFLSSS